MAATYKNKQYDANTKKPEQVKQTASVTINILPSMRLISQR